MKRLHSSEGSGTLAAGARSTIDSSGETSAGLKKVPHGTASRKMAEGELYFGDLDPSRQKIVLQRMRSLWEPWLIPDPAPTEAPHLLSPSITRLAKRSTVVFFAAASCWMLAFFLPGGILSLVFFQAGLISIGLFGASVALNLRFSDSLERKIEALEDSSGVGEGSPEELVQRVDVPLEDLSVDFSPELTGAQGSLYARGKIALDQCLPLLADLRPLDPEADAGYIKSLREMARSQMSELVKEFAVLGGPSITRTDTYFAILLGQNPITQIVDIEFDPDQVRGTLGELRDTYGVWFKGNPFLNTVEDEREVTKFRVISDSMTSLLQAWVSNRGFFVLRPGTQAFFGTQMVLLARQFSTILESTKQTRGALEASGIGPSEQRTLLLEFKDRSLAPIFIDSLLRQVEELVGGQIPRLLRDAGRISVTNNIHPVLSMVRHMVREAIDPVNMKALPDGFRSERVHDALIKLADNLGELKGLFSQVTQEVPIDESGRVKPAKTRRNITVSVAGSSVTLAPAATQPASSVIGVPPVGPLEDLERQIGERKSRREIP